MKKKEMDDLLNRSIENLNEEEKKELIEGLKKVKNISIRQNIAALTIPFVIVSSVAGLYFKSKDAQPFVPDTYVQDYYYSYYQDKDKLTLITDSEILDGQVVPEDEMIIAKSPWEKTGAFYTRDVVYYNTALDIDKEKATQIIKNGYESVPVYINEEVKREKEQTTDLEFVNESNNGEVALSYREFNTSKELKRDATITLLNSMGTFAAGALASCLTHPIVSADIRYRKSNKLLQELGYEDSKKKIKKK